MISNRWVRRDVGQQRPWRLMFTYAWLIECRRNCIRPQGRIHLFHLSEHVQRSFPLFALYIRVIRSLARWLLKRFLLLCNCTLQDLMLGLVSPTHTYTSSRHSHARHRTRSFIWRKNKNTTVRRPCIRHACTKTYMCELYCMAGNKWITRKHSTKQKAFYSPIIIDEKCGM